MIMMMGDWASDTPALKAARTGQTNVVELWCEGKKLPKGYTIN
jgi:hypothetical protein